MISIYSCSRLLALALAIKKGPADLCQPTLQTTEIRVLCQLATFYRSTLGGANFYFITLFKLVSIIATVESDGLSIYLGNFTFHSGGEAHRCGGRNKHQDKRSSTNFLHDRSPFNDLSMCQTLSGIRNECMILSNFCNDGSTSVANSLYLSIR
jgi:hypothetical protein